MNFRSTLTMASWLSITFNVHDFFARQNENQPWEEKRVKINNLKMARNLGIILKEEFKEKVNAILEL